MICPACHTFHQSDDDLNTLINGQFHLCDRCYQTFLPLWERFTVAGVPGLAIYQYAQGAKDLLFQLKGGGDITLASIFIERFRVVLSLRFEGYIMTFVPSNLDEDQQRGFNHVEMIFSALYLKKQKCFYKKISYKQSSQKDRRQIANVIDLIPGVKLPKKVLIVDDVMTSGNSLSACIELLKQHHVHKIKVLVMSKVCR